MRTCSSGWWGPDLRDNILTELMQVAAMACMMTNAVKFQWPAPTPSGSIGDDAQ